jgi:transposase-like protein
VTGREVEDEDLPDPVALDCPYCGELVDLHVDAGGGERQRYVEDCPVCCSPWAVEVERDASGWSARLRTLDE